MSTTQGSPRRDSGTVLLVIALFTITAAAFMRAPLLPDIGREFVMGATELSLITTGLAVGRAIANYPAGKLADRVQPNRLLAVAALLMAVACGGIALATHPGVLVGWTVVAGLTSGLTSTVAMTELTRSAAPERRGRAMAIYTSALMTGQLSGPAFAGLLAAALSWRIVHSIAGCVCVVLGVVILAFSARKTRRGTAAVATGPAAPQGAGAGASRAGGEDRLTLRVLAIVSTISFAVFFGLGGLSFTLAPIIASGEFGMSTAWLGMLLGAAGLGRLLGSLAAGRIADSISRRAALIPSLWLMAAGTAVVMIAHPLALVIGVLLFSVASSGAAIAGTVIGDLSVKRRLGSRMGLYRTVGDIGFLLGPVLGTLCYEAWGRVGASLALTGVVILAGLFAFALPESSPMRVKGDG